MAEVRSVSATGGEKGVKPERYDLLPKVGLDAMARVYAFGAKKYADHNWRRGYEWSKSLAAAGRHMAAFQDGETCDPESGLPHPAHAMFHMAALLTWLEEQGEGADNPMDDRWPAGMERARRESAAEEEARLLAEQEELDDIGHIPPRYVSDVPSGTGDLTDVEAPVEAFERKAEDQGLELDKAAALHDITLPFFPDATPPDDEGYATVWVHPWDEVHPPVGRSVMQHLLEAADLVSLGNITPHFTVSAVGVVTDNFEIPREDLRF